MSTFVFADIGKKSRDLLSKDFVTLDDKKKYTRTAVEVKTKSLSGTGFIFTASRKATEAAAENSFDGKVQVKRACKEWNLEYDTTVALDSIKVNGTHTVSAVDGLKVGLAGDFGTGADNAGTVGGSFSADYKKSGNAVNFKLTADREKNKKIVDVSAAHTHNNTVVGATASFTVEESAKGPSKVGVSAQHQGLDSQVSVAVLAKLPKKAAAPAAADADAEAGAGAGAGKDADAPATEGRDISATFNVYHEYSASSQFGVEAVVPLRKVETDASIKVGLVHKLADDETVRARFEIGGSNSQHLGLSYSTRFGAHTSITASTDLAVSEILASGLSASAARVGISVSLNAE